VQAQALDVDAFIASAYASAVSDAGWTFGTRQYQVTDSAACRTAFASYFCLNPSILASYSLNGSCGVESPAAFSPCLKRCITFQIACLGRGATSAGSACSAMAATGMNTASNANCFCSDSRETSSVSSTCLASCSKDGECSGAPRAGPPQAAAILSAAWLALAVASALPLVG
jgi:hypothetical protein